MLGDFDTDLPHLLKDALDWIEATANYLHRYLVDPNRHPGGTNDSSLTLSAGRRELIEDVLAIAKGLVPDAEAHLGKGNLERAAQLVVHGQACIADALIYLLTASAYETGRVEAEGRAQVEVDEAKKRSDNSRMGAPKPTFTDDALKEYITAWRVKKGKKHGSIKAAAAHFSVTDTAIGKRLRKIGTG